MIASVYKHLASALPPAWETPNRRDWPALRAEAVSPDVRRYGRSERQNVGGTVLETVAVGLVFASWLIVAALAVYWDWRHR